MLSKISLFFCRLQWGIFFAVMMKQETCVKDTMLSIMSVGFNYGCPAWSTNRVMPGTFFSLSSGFIVANSSLLCCWARAQKSTSNFAYILFDARGQLLTCVLWQATLYFEPMVLLPDVHAQSQLKWCMMFSLSCSERVAEFCCPF